MSVETKRKREEQTIVDDDFAKRHAKRVKFLKELKEKDIHNNYTNLEMDSFDESEFYFIPEDRQILALQVLGLVERFKLKQDVMDMLYHDKSILMDNGLTAKQVNLIEDKKIDRQSVFRFVEACRLLLHTMDRLGPRIKKYEKILATQREKLDFLVNKVHAKAANEVPDQEARIKITEDRLQKLREQQKKSN